MYMGGAHFNYEANFVVENRCCKISWFINIGIPAKTTIVTSVK